MALACAQQQYPWASYPYSGAVTHIVEQLTCAIALVLTNLPDGMAF